MKIAWVFILNLFIFINTSQGQDSLNDKSLTVKYLIKRGYFFRDSAGYASIPSNQKKWPDKLYYNTVYTSKFLGSPTVPFNFTKIEYVDGEFLVSPTLSLGYGYTWFTGDFIFNEYDKIIVNPGVFFGAVGNVGLQSNFSFSRLGNFFLGGFIGIGSFSLFAGYDFVSLSPTIGLGGRLDLYTIKQDYLNPIGSVKELRKHKSFAFPITYE